MDDRFECSGLVVDFARREVMQCGHIIHLTPTENKLLTLLARYNGKVLTSARILAEVWGGAYSSESQILRTHTGRLRRKIEVDSNRQSLIITEPGVGYWLRC